MTALRRVFAGILLAMLPLIGAGVSPAAAKMFSPESFTLANGLQVVVVANHRAPVVTHMVWIKAGSADEIAGKTGIAHFLEHLMFRGTTAVGPGQFSEIVSRLGGDENAFTTSDYTAYYESVAAGSLERMMELDADRLQNLNLTDATVLPERDVILEERRQRIDNDPGAQLGEMLNAALYLNAPYHHPVIGWEHEMEGLTTADARGFYDRWYAPNNLVVVISGDVTLASVKPLAEKYYGPIAARAVPERARAEEPLQFAPRRVRLESAQVRQASWVRAYQAPSYHTAGAEHAYALQVLAQILGGDSTSRLYRHLVVEQKLAVAADADYSASRLGVSAFSLSATPPAGGKLDLLEAAMDKEVANLLAGGVTADEVARAVASLQAAAIKAADSLAGPARILGAALASGATIEDVEAWPDRIGAVTVDQVNAAAKAVFDINRSATGLLLPKETS
jgi:zinc protease